MKLTGRIAAAIAVLYALLLIPAGERARIPPVGESAQEQAFAWNQDDSWKALEAAYRSLKEGGCGAAVLALDAQFEAVQEVLRGIADERPGPADPVFRELQRRTFEIGPVVGACGARVAEYLRLAADLRTAVKERSRDWDLGSAAARDTLYRLLYGSRAAAEEVILQAGAGTVPSLLPGKDEPSATPWAEVRGVRIHSGDILVSRGGAPTSALIARGSDYPGNFSHIAFVHVDPATRAASIVEAHIEVGVVVSTVEQYLRDKKLRVMLLRPRADLPRLLEDPLLPHQAAQLAHGNATSRHVPYDFAMDYREHSKLFCSEVASAAYEASGVTLWAGISRISSPGLRRWLGDLGVRHFETQEPSDLEYDPQLAVVAEWRDPETLRKDRLDNAVTEAMLEGAEAGDELDYPRLLLPLARLAKGYSAALNLAGRAGPVPEGMPAETALRSLWYARRHDAIAALLAGRAAAFRAERGYEPPYWELVRLAREAKREAEART